MWCKSIYTHHSALNEHRMTSKKWKYHEYTNTCACAHMENVGLWLCVSTQILLCTSYTRLHCYAMLRLRRRWCCDCIERHVEIQCTLFMLYDMEIKMKLYSLLVWIHGNGKSQLRWNSFVISVSAVVVLVVHCPNISYV